MTDPRCTPHHIQLDNPLMKQILGRVAKTQTTTFNLLCIMSDMRMVQVNAHVEGQRSFTTPTVCGSPLHLFLCTCNSISDALKSKSYCISALNGTINKMDSIQLSHDLLFVFVCFHILLRIQYRLISMFGKSTKQGQEFKSCRVGRNRSSVGTSFFFSSQKCYQTVVNLHSVSD